MAHQLTMTEKRVIKAMIRLDRAATSNEIARWADMMSWNTADKTLRNLKELAVVEKTIAGRKDAWQMRYKP